MTADATHAGRSIFVDGACGAAELSVLVAEAFALPPSAALTAASTMADLETAWNGSGWVQVASLEPESEFRFHVEIVLHRPTLDTGVFPVLAMRHGLLVAWCVDEHVEPDWHYRVARPDGSITVRWFEFPESGDSYAVRSAPPMRTGGGS